MGLLPQLRVSIEQKFSLCNFCTFLFFFLFYFLVPFFFFASFRPKFLLVGSTPDVSPEQGRLPPARW